MSLLVRCAPAAAVRGRHRAERCRGFPAIPNKAFELSLHSAIGNKPSGIGAQQNVGRETRGVHSRHSTTTQFVADRGSHLAIPQASFARAGFASPPSPGGSVGCSKRGSAELVKNGSADRRVAGGRGGNISGGDLSRSDRSGRHSQLRPRQSSGAGYVRGVAGGGQSPVRAQDGSRNGRRTAVRPVVGIGLGNPGAIAGASAGFAFVRWLGAEGSLDTSPGIGRLVQRAERGGWRAVAIVRLTPFPHSIANTALALTKVSWRDYLVRIISRDVADDGGTGLHGCFRRPVLARTWQLGCGVLAVGGRFGSLVSLPKHAASKTACSRS